MKFSTYEFALMNSLIRLGESYGLKPWQVCIEYDSSTGKTYVAGSPADEIGIHKNHEAMLDALGFDPNGDGALPYEEGQEMMEAIEIAIKKAPRKWAR